jgi:hypothetical protein
MAMTTTTAAMSAMSLASSRARHRATTAAPTTPIRARAARGRAARDARRRVDARGVNDDEYGSLGQVCTGA